MHALQQTDKCNAEYEAQLNVKHEKLRQQLKYFEATQRNIIELNHQLENNGNKGISEVGTFGILRQNTNYCSLPLSGKLRSITGDGVQHICQEIDAQHCLNAQKDTQKFDASTYDNETKMNKSSNDPSSGNNVNLSAAMVSDVASSSTFLPAVNSEKWTADGISHSENLRKTSYLMMGRFAAQQGEIYQSSCIPPIVDCKLSVSTSGHRLSDVNRGLPVATESVCIRSPGTVNEPREVERHLQLKDITCSSLQPGVDDLGRDVSSPLSRPSANPDRYGEHILLPDIIGPMSDNITQQNVSEYDKLSCGSTDTVPTLSLTAASKIPPPVAQKPKFRYPRSAGVTDCDNIAVSTPPNVITATPHGSIDVLSTGTSFSSKQDFALQMLQWQNMLDEPPLIKSGDVGQKMAFADDGDGQDLTDSSRLVNRLTYKPSVMCPVRRRRSSVGEGCETSGELQSNEEIISMAEDSAVCSEGNVSRVQTVKNKLQASLSRRVQFEPLALLLDAALEGEIDLLQTTLKVRTYKTSTFLHFTSTDLVFAS